MEDKRRGERKDIFRFLRESVSSLCQITVSKNGYCIVHNIFVCFDLCRGVSVVHVVL